MTPALLRTESISVAYGRVQALTDVDITVPDGKIVTVLGANGAGKSTLLQAILGVVRTQSGRVWFEGNYLEDKAPTSRMAAGVVLVPEGRRILITVTVEENLLLGAHLRSDLALVRREIDAIYARFPNLAERRHMAASCLSGGEQQMLALGRAMLAQPRLLMLDEPSLGLSPLFVDRMFDLINDLNRDGLSILLVEQNTGKALKVADYAYVLELGRVVAQGTPRELAADDTLRQAYLG